MAPTRGPATTASIAWSTRVDKVWDVGGDGLRFLEDGSADCVYASHLLEHVPFVPMLREIHRVLKVGGTAEIYVPHGSSVAGYVDPTHIRPGYAFRTWDYVESGAYDLPSFRIVWRRLTSNLEATSSGSPGSSTIFLGFSNGTSPMPWEAVTRLVL